MHAHQRQRPTSVADQAAEAGIEQLAPPLEHLEQMEGRL